MPKWKSWENLLGIQISSSSSHFHWWIAVTLLRCILRKPEIGYLATHAVIQKYVAWFNISVYDTTPCKIVQIYQPWTRKTSNELCRYRNKRKHLHCSIFIDQRSTQSNRTFQELHKKEYLIWFLYRPERNKQSGYSHNKGASYLLLHQYKQIAW